MAGRTLRDVVEHVDSERFVGRRVELSVAAAALEPTSAVRIVYLHGPGGIGKSATARAVGRLAAGSGYRVVSPDLGQTPDEVDAAIDRAAGMRTHPLLVVLDDVGVLGSRLPQLRDRLLDVLPDTARLLVCGRAAPDPTWRAGGLDAIVADVALGPLADDDASLLLEHRGVAATHRPEVVAWAQGSPLALTVAASAPGGSAVLERGELEARLTAWLAGRPMLDVADDVLAVAAIAPSVDARLLAAALPSRSTRGALDQLAALPVAERTGDRVVLHVVLAAAVRARLEAAESERFWTIRRRVAEHLAGRARLGDIRALTELSQFIRDPHLRQAVSNEPSASLFTSRPQPGELASFARSQGFDTGPDWEEVALWSEEAGRYPLCVRRRTGSIVLYATFALVAEHPVLGPVTSSLARAAEATGVDPARSCTGVVLFAEGTEHEHAEAARLGAGALMHLHGIADLQAVLIHYPPPDRRPIEALSPIAAELDDALPRMVALSDFRPLGVVGFVEEVVLAEMGAAPRRTDVVALLARDDDPDREARLVAVLDEVFGPSADDQRMRRAIELAHLSPRQSERACLAALHLSRSSWFRLLRRARERLLAADSRDLGGPGGPGGPGRSGSEGSGAAGTLGRA